MYLGTITKVLSKSDIESGKVHLPIEDVKEKFISHMNEDLQDKVLEDERHLKVVLFNEVDSSTLTLSFNFTKRDVFSFSRFGQVVRASNLKDGDKVEFKLEKVVGEEMHISFGVVSRKKFDPKNWVQRTKSTSSK